MSAFVDAATRSRSTSFNAAPAGDRVLDLLR
jgi:hypothetical protein